MITASQNTSSSSAAAPSFEVLVDERAAAPLELPETLARASGAFGIEEPSLFANFVSSLDGAVALPAIEKSSSVIGGGSVADRFMVALLRAAAHAVVVGAGTYRAHRGPWTAESAFPDLGDSFAELRLGLRIAPEPLFAVVTRSGDLGPPRPYLRGALVVAPPDAR